MTSPEENKNTVAKETEVNENVTDTTADNTDNDAKESPAEQATDDLEAIKKNLKLKKLYYRKVKNITKDCKQIL